jgi:hypothetical protein
MLLRMKVNTAKALRRKEKNKGEKNLPFVCQRKNLSKSEKSES